MRKSLVLLGGLALIAPGAAFAQATTPVQGTEPPVYGTDNPDTPSNNGDNATNSTYEHEMNDDGMNSMKNPDDMIGTGTSQAKPHHHHMPIGTSSSGSSGSNTNNSGYVTEPNVPPPTPSYNMPGGGVGTNSTPH